MAWSLADTDMQKWTIHVKHHTDPVYTYRCRGDTDPAPSDARKQITLAASSAYMTLQYHHLNYGSTTKRRSRSHLQTDSCSLDAGNDLAQSLEWGLELQRKSHDALMEIR